MLGHHSGHRMVLTLECRLSSFFLYDILYCASDYHLLTTLLEKNFHPDNDIPSRNLRSVIFFASFRLYQDSKYLHRQLLCVRWNFGGTRFVQIICRKRAQLISRPKQKDSTEDKRSDSNFGQYET